jgi:7-cyano-7-deazaguanine synthase in queuosine biosynthesis
MSLSFSEIYNDIYPENGRELFIKEMKKAIAMSHDREAKTRARMMKKLI